MIEFQRGRGQYVQAADFSRLHQGFAPSGPQDRHSCQLANRLLGNDRHAGAWEFTLPNAIVRMRRDCHFVVGGAPCGVTIDGVDHRDWTVLFAKAGAEVQLRIGRIGCRVYLCVAGGVCHDGSFTDASLSAKVGHAKPDHRPDWQPPLGTVRVLPGPEWTDAAAKPLLETSWKIDSQSNALGLRLNGPTLPFTSCDIESAPVQDGTVQATKAGLLALLRNRGTLGGYRRLATVIDCDVDRLAQFRPGHQLRFQRVDETTAQEMIRRQQNEINAT